MLTTTSIFIVILLSSFFSSVEAAFFSITKAKVNSLAEKSTAGKLLQSMKNNTEQFVSTIVCGNNIVNIIGTMMVTVIATEEFGEAYLGLISGIFTFLVIIFAEVIPKNIGEKFCEPLLMKTVFVVKPLMFILTPLVFLINLINGIAMKLLSNNADKIIDEEEVVETVKMSVADGVIHKDFFDKFKKILTLDDVKVKKIMTPKNKITHVKSGSSIENLSYDFKHSQHSRILVTEDGDLNKIKGYVLQKVMVQFLADDKDDLIDRYLIDVVMVEEDMLLVDLIEILMKEAPLNTKAIRYIAAVKDKEGNTVGIVTLEDVIEEIFGEIIDETDS